MAEKSFPRLRSFVRREGRMTAVQKNALQRRWPIYGLNIDDGLLDIQKVFGRDAPVVLEIGFGMGGSFFELAVRHPEKNYVGIEVHRPGVGSLLSKVEQQAVENVRVYSDDAVQVLEQCISNDSLDAIYIYFPDPWPKKRHHKRRLIQPPFVALATTKLKLGGSFHVATDWENYAEHCMGVLSAEDSLKNLAGHGCFTDRPESRPLTKFEKRGKVLGHGVWDLCFAKS
jgi:tRNA (guanine-N7-)-methyltransferase